VKPAAEYSPRLRAPLLGRRADSTMCVSAGGYVRSSRTSWRTGRVRGTSLHIAANPGRPFSRLHRRITVDDLKLLSAAEIEARLPHPRTLLPECPASRVDDSHGGPGFATAWQVNLPDFSQGPMVEDIPSPVDLLAIGRRVAGTLMQPVVVMGWKAP